MIHLRGMEKNAMKLIEQELRMSQRKIISLTTFPSKFLKVMTN